MAVTEKVVRIQAMVDDTDAPATGVLGNIHTLIGTESRQTEAQLIATGTQTLTLWFQTPFAAIVTESFLGIQVTQAANANSKSFRLAWDDGAAGADTNLTSLYDGTASAVTQDRKNAMTVTPGVVIPAGSRVFLVATTNGTGAAMDIQHECRLKWI